MIRAVVTVAASVFTVELLVMGLLQKNVVELSPFADATLDALLLSLVTVPAVVFVVVQPMRRRITAQLEALQVNVDRLACLTRAFSSSQQGMLVTNLDTTILSVNPAFLQLSGYRAEDVLGRTPRLLDPGLEEEPSSVERWAQLSSGRGWQGRQVLRGRTGDLVDVSMTLSPVVDDAGSTTGYVALYSDLREQVAHERELTSLLVAQRAVNRELDAARLQAFEASQAKSRFLATMSHEIRTPLAGLLGTLELLVDHPLEGEERELANVALETGRGMVGVLNDVLDFSKIEAGRVELESIAFDAAALVRGVRGVFRAQAKSRGLALHLHVPAAAAWVRGDPTRLRQVLLNLVGNAVKFTREGAVSVTLDSGDLEGARWLQFSVRDTGVGISPSAQRHLFEPFVQNDASTTRTHGGTGLGLAISRQLVAKMGGRLELETVEGVGSRFFFGLELPVAPSVTIAGSSPPTPADRALLAGRRVLLADDNAVIRLVVSRHLERLGCTVTVVEDGAKAVEALERGPAYDTVVMDCQMPFVDGLAATRAIRHASAPWRHVPVIALTANAQPEDREACFAAGMTSFLTKPVGEAALARALVDALEPRPAASPCRSDPKGGAAPSSW